MKRHRLFQYMLETYNIWKYAYFYRKEIRYHMQLKKLMFVSSLIGSHFESLRTKVFSVMTVPSRTLGVDISFDDSIFISRSWQFIQSYPLEVIVLKERKLFVHTLLLHIASQKLLSERRYVKHPTYHFYRKAVAVASSQADCRSWYCCYCYCQYPDNFYSKTKLTDL